MMKKSKKILLSKLFLLIFSISTIISIIFIFININSNKNTNISKNKYGSITYLGIDYIYNPSHEKTGNISTTELNFSYISYDSQYTNNIYLRTSTKNEDGSFTIINNWFLLESFNYSVENYVFYIDFLEPKKNYKVELKLNHEEDYESSKTINFNFKTTTSDCLEGLYFCIGPNFPIIESSSKINTIEINFNFMINNSNGIVVTELTLEDMTIIHPETYYDTFFSSSKDNKKEFFHLQPNTTYIVWLGTTDSPFFTGHKITTKI